MSVGSADTKRKPLSVGRWGAVMDWSKEYKTERRIDWADVAQTIRDTVSMDDVLDVYAPEIPRRNHRCPCPFHNGKDFNMSYMYSGYKCFVCGVGGDVIAFVKDKLGLATRADAMKRINADFHLNIPIDRNITTAENSEIAKRREAAERKRKEITDWNELYDRLMDEWCRCDREKMNSEPMSDEWCNAVKRLEYIGYLLDGLPPEPR